MDTLLSEKFSRYFSLDFPIVYKLGVPKDGSLKEVSAIDIALSND